VKIGVVIPTRDRPEFLKNALRLIGDQTRQPDIVEVVDDPARSAEKDVAWRYKLGYERIGHKCDVVAFWEDDDWYSKDYIKIMSKAWDAYGEPFLLGINNTMYYHIKTRKYINLYHPNRASAMSTLIRGRETIDFGDIYNPFVDIVLWRNYQGATFDPGRVNIGIKHGKGITGGIGHREDWDGYKKDDSRMTRIFCEL